MTTAIYLFTNDLRIQDNIALHLASRYQQLVCVFCVQPYWFKNSRYGITPMSYGRWQLLQESLSAVQQQLHRLGQQLHICYGELTLKLQQLVQQTQAETLIVSRQFRYWERQQLIQLTKTTGIPIRSVDNYTLYSAKTLPWLVQQLPKHYSPFRCKIETEPFEAPLPAPDALPASQTGFRFFNTVPDWLPNPKPIQTAFSGGELAANTQLQEYFHSQAPLHYKQTRNALQGWHSSSKLSVWLSQGNVSAKQVMHSIHEYECDYGNNESTQWLFVELLWREYFQWLSLSYGAQLFSFKGKAKQAPKTTFYPDLFKRWCEGTTPFPLVNACMKELKATGYLSNRGRQIAASALVNELGVDWRYGAAWFEHHLLDYDVASNWGNWQYIAGVGCDPRGGRHFNIDKQSQQYDPTGDYVKRWQGDTTLPLHSQDPTGWPIAPNDV